eukprot:GHVL01014583.1.p1 GENE.GHVL01014583.1~~GHVL01014583.1.p1  ORF type:complete len:474 (+),score=81.75 GHVL01014583.1:24-1445(+)
MGDNYKKNKKIFLITKMGNSIKCIKTAESTESIANTLFSSEKRAGPAGSSLISNSYAYGILQAASDSIFVDCRQRDSYVSRIQGAVCLETTDFSHVARQKRIVLYGNDDEVTSAIDRLVQLNVRSSNIYVLHGGFEIFSKRFPFCIAEDNKSQKRQNAPIEIISPGSLSMKPSNSGFALYISSEAVCKACCVSFENKDMSVIKQLRIRYIINLTNKKQEKIRNVRIYNFNCQEENLAELPYNKAAEIIKKCKKTNKACLIYDSLGKTHAAAVSVWFLLMYMSVDEAISYVSLKHPEAEFYGYVRQCLYQQKDYLKGVSKIPPTVVPPKITATSPPRAQPITDISSRNQLQAVADYISNSQTGPSYCLYDTIDETISRIKSTVPSKQYNESLRTLHIIFNNISSNPAEPKYRTLRMGNERFHKNVGQYSVCLDLMSLAGFVRDTKKQVWYLPPSSFLQNLRDVDGRLTLALNLN